MARQMVDVYAEFARNAAAMPVIAGNLMLPRVCPHLPALHSLHRPRASCQASIMVSPELASARCIQI